MKKIILFVLSFSAFIIAKGGDDKQRPKNILGYPSGTHININNISSYFQNNGSSDVSPGGVNPGLIYPKGSGKNASFQSGLVWGGKVDGQVRVGGSTYFQGTIPGRILPNGTAANPSGSDVRIYRVRRDYKNSNANFSSEINDKDGSSSADVYAQYDRDWHDWPALQGAPFEDVNRDRKYDPSIDIPGVQGADQTIWFVCNDLDLATVNSMYGSPPMGIEEQVTIWAYNQTNALGNMFFRKYTLINKNPNQKPFDEMFVSMWSDVDLGDASDDFIGCDSLLSLMYFYNGKAVDQVYSPLPPPATGFDFFQGPKIPGAATDVAIFKDKYVKGFRNLPTTSFYYFINNDPVLVDPTRANYTKGTLEFWNLLHGKISGTGTPFTDPNTHKQTLFPLAGDPITNSGWIDGQLNAAGDRRGGMVSGPFNMAYGDTQEVVIAEICAGATIGVDRLAAIQLLKQYDKDGQLAYSNFFKIPNDVKEERVIPVEFSLSQNYPNPFNPTTKIKFDIPKQSHVKLLVYDILGREIDRLVDKEMLPGSYEATFDGKSAAGGLPSGVYFYRIEAGEFVKSSKMVLTK